jgi:hypothetical protein
LAAEAESISRASSPRSIVVRDATEIIEIDLMRRRAAHFGTRQVQPHSAQVRTYSCGCHGNRMEIIFHEDAE